MGLDNNEFYIATPPVPVRSTPPQLDESVEAGDAGDALPEGIDEGDLAAFLEQNQGGSDDAGDDDVPSQVDTKAKAGKARHEDPAHDDEEPRNDSHSRMVRKLAQRERELSQHRAQVRQLEQRLSQAESARQEPTDVIELIRGRIARDLGVQPNDPRVKEALFELSRDLTLDHLGAAVDADPELRTLRLQRQEQRQRQAERRSLEERIERIEREKLDAQRMAMDSARKGAIQGIIQRDAEALPFLMAQSDVDPAEAVMELALEAVRTGQAPLPRSNDPEEADRLATRFVRSLAKGLDDHYRSLAEALSKKLGPKDETSERHLDNRGTPRTAKKQDAPKRRTGATGTGGGGRGRAPEQRPNEDDEEDNLVEYFKRQTEVEQARNRGRR